MIENNANLSASHIKYLIALLKLTKNQNGVRCVDIANALSVSKPSVHAMIKTLCKMNLVEYERYGVAFLNKEGKNLANKYINYANTLKLCLKGCYKDGTDIDNAVFAFLAEIEPEKVDNLAKFSQKEKRKVS